MRMGRFSLCAVHPSFFFWGGGRRVVLGWGVRFFSFWPRFTCLDLEIKPFLLFSFLARSSQPHLFASLTVTLVMVILQLRML